MLAERERSLAKERESSVDAALIASLEADQAQLRSALTAIDHAAAALLPEADEVERAEAGLAEARARFEERWGDGVPGQLGRSRRGPRRARRPAQRGRPGAAPSSSASTSGSARSPTSATASGPRPNVCATEIADADRQLPDLVADAGTAAAAERAAAETALEAAGDALADADAERRSWTARAEALALALDEARSAAGAERLAEVDGVIGTLLDLVEVDPGWEAAFEAAAADALAAVVVDGPRCRPGRVRCSRRRRRHRCRARPRCRPRSPARRRRWVDRSANHVRSARADVDHLLDAIVGAAVAVDGDWAAGLDIALAHPDAVVVTADGARFGPGAWRVGGTATGATGAALDEAEAAAGRAEAAVVAATETRDAARQRLADAKRAATETREQAEKAAAGRRRADEALVRVRQQAAEADDELAGGNALRSDLDQRIAGERSRLAELEAALPALEAEEAAASEAARAMADARSALDERATAVSALRSDLEVRAAQLEERRSSLQTRLAEVDARLERNHAAAAEAAVRREALDERARALHGLATACDASLAAIEERLVVLREERRAQSEAQRQVSVALDGLRRERVGVERELAEVRERMQRADLELNEINLRIETAVESMRRDLDIDPDTALASEAPELPEGASPAARTRELERELRLMGPINPLALEEFEALQERHTFLQGQLDDVKASRRELSKVIKAVDDEIVNVFAGAFADVSQNFTALFQTLFPGGKGGISLTDPGDLLETGIEIEAKPSGKNVRKLSLLSGGERSLTALAFLFAVFRSRPSPFYVMDEVEAALDDVNLHRFLDLVAEFRQEAQLVIVSHQKRTMEAADVLYGVTMSPGGSSRVVSEKGAAATAGAA